MKTEISMDNLNDLVEENMGLIIHTISSITGRYVQIVHDDTFSIALSAFAEAVEKYSPEKGTFSSFAIIVMKSRIITYLNKERKDNNWLSLEAMSEEGIEIPFESYDKLELKNEIKEFSDELKKFNLSFDVLAEKAPKHKDTRTRAVKIAEKSSENKNIVETTYNKKRLPIRNVATFCNVSEKIIKTSKTFILATMLVFVKKLSCLIDWIKEAR